MELAGIATKRTRHYCGSFNSSTFDKLILAQVAGRGAADEPRYMAWFVPVTLGQSLGRATRPRGVQDRRLVLVVKRANQGYRSILVCRHVASGHGLPRCDRLFLR